MRATLLDFPVDILSREETIQLILSAIANNQRLRHVALNVAKLVNARRNIELEGDIRASDIIGIDGMGIVFALRLLGYRVPERVAGVDLFESLIAECADRGLKLFLLGATSEVLVEAERKLLQRYPNLILAGKHDGYFAANEEADVCDQIRKSGAHCLCVAMPTPSKERFMQRHSGSLGIPFMMGIGGTLDVVAGRVQRAPVTVQRIGLEWAYRMAQEPRRLGGRYLYTNLVFAFLLMRALLGRSTRSLWAFIGNSKSKNARATASDQQ